MRNDRRLVDFEFTMAMNNATGKFFAGVAFPVPPGWMGAAR
jgi:hypothetical protein